MPLRSARPGSSNSLSRIAAICIGVVILLFVVVASVYFTLGNSTSSGANCDEQLAGEIGAKNLCLQPLSVGISKINASEYTVPVLVIKPGSVAMLSILYHLVVNGISGSSTHVRPNITSKTLPYTLSVKTGVLSSNELKFENASMVFQNQTWILFSYELIAAGNASGYYAVLPPFYYGFYPAIAVETNSNNLNQTDLGMWGFDGIIESGEFVVPSTIVSTSNANVVNVTVPGTTACPNSACTVITHSGY